MSTIPSIQHRKPYGFTIVELLIVIVVIAILASITIVAYNGVQQRANNTAIIDAASQSLRMIQAYIAANGTYPAAVSSGTIAECVTSSSGCVDQGGYITSSDTTFNTNIATIGTLPTSIPTIGTVAIGIRYHYDPTRTFNGSVQPGLLQYFLLGYQQNCGVSNVMSAWQTAVASATGYTSSGTIGGIAKTTCYVSIPGPSA